MDRHNYMSQLYNKIYLKLSSKLYQYKFIALILVFLPVNTNAQCWKIVSANGGHTEAIKLDGTLWSWGANSYGELGIGDNKGKHIPVQVGFDTIWKQVETGDQFTIGLKNDGTLWSWGSNSCGRLGDGTSINHNIPIQIGVDADWGQVAVKSVHILALKNDGTLWGWGSNYNWKLGTGVLQQCYLTPTQIGTDTDWQQIITGFDHSFGIKKDGSLWAWGLNNFGQLGIGSTIDQKTPIKINSDLDWKYVVAGVYHTMAIKNDSSLWGWGDNSVGQLAMGNLKMLITPTQINTIKWLRISAGAYFTLALKNDSSLYSWGYNSYGQLGDGTNIESHIPVKIDNNKWQQIIGGGFNSFSIDNDYSLWGWGLNFDGQLGNGSTINSFLPIEINCPITSTNYTYNLIEDISLFPNPGQDYLELRLSNIEAQGLKYEIRSILGKEVIPPQTLINDQDIDISNLLPGVYIITIKNKEGQISKKFVKL